MYATDAIVGDELRTLHGKAHVSQLDVTSDAPIKALKLKLSDEPVDVVLNIAGR